MGKKKRGGVVRLAARRARDKPTDPERKLIILRPGLREWQAYLRRTLPEAPPQVCLDAYERHLKYGPTRTYWNDFVFEGYVNHRSGVVYLAGPRPPMKTGSRWR